MNLYTIANCPVCGATFNKHANARYCSPRCAKKAGRERRQARYAGPTTVDPYVPNPHRADFLGSTPIEHTVLLQISQQVYDAYHGKQTKLGNTLHGGGELRIIDFSTEALGDFVPPAPLILREKPRVLEDDPRIISMALPQAFGEESTPPPTPDPNFAPPSAIDILNQFSK